MAATVWITPMGALLIAALIVAFLVYHRLANRIHRAEWDRLRRRHHLDDHGGDKETDAP